MNQLDENWFHYCSRCGSLNRLKQLPFCEYCVPPEKYDLGIKLLKELVKKTKTPVFLSVANRYSKTNWNMIKSELEFLKSLKGENSRIYKATLARFPGIDL